MKKTIIFGLIIILATVLIDQITKALMVSLLVTEGNFIVVIPEFFKLKLHYNTGAAFSSFDGNFPFLMIMTAVATIVFIYMAKYADFKSKKFYSWGIYLMIGGMIGNFIDRVFNYGEGVVDFLAFTFFKTYDFAVFNMADTFLVVGVICIMIDILFFEAKREKKVKEIEIKE